MSKSTIVRTIRLSKARNIGINAGEANAIMTKVREVQARLQMLDPSRKCTQADAVVHALDAFLAELRKKP